ncbi:MAG: DNA-directed RNA polymerase subunit alpha C-terminal domain-containing protein [Candidatus Thiodiazotropha sp.]
MNTLRLYLNIYSDGKRTETVVYRDLASLELGWKERTSLSKTGIVHVGFIRPKIKFTDRRPELLGNIIVTASAKWALPKAYEVTEAPISILEVDQRMTPCFLIVKGFGINLEASQYQELEMDINDQESSPVNTKGCNENTILSAAKEVLKKIGKPLNKEEIFAHIIQDGLYNFGAKRPIEVLAVELNRNVLGSEYSKASNTSCLGKTIDERFYYIDGDNVQLSGWIKALEDSSPELASELMSYGVYDENSYKDSSKIISARLLKIADVYRYKVLKFSTDNCDPEKLLPIIPNEILDSPISILGFSVRVENVLSRQGFKTLRELTPYSESEMLKWSQFGQRSVTDFCMKLIEISDNLASEIGRIESLPIEEVSSGKDGNDHDPMIELSAMEAIERKPLIEHFEDALFKLRDKERRIIEGRTGANGPVLTLQAVAEKMDITRERVRQIQKKYVDKIIQQEYWDDCIGITIGQLLASRKDPLFLEMLELEDEWFKGFIGNYDHLAAIIELFSQNEIRVINVRGSNIVTRIKQDVWDKSVTTLGKSLKDKADEKQWTRADIELLLSSHLNDVGAPELTGLLFKEFDDALQFNGEGGSALFVAFGKSAESAVAAVLEQAESPLHYSEVATRATQLLGKPVDERRAQGALQAQKAKLYGRGIYGLERFNPVPERMCNNIRLVVSKMMYEGPVTRQWHSAGILKRLRHKFPSLPDELDTYILNIILEKEERLNYLNRMVWARSDSGQCADDRIDMADAFTKFLQDNGAPMKGTDLREKLREIRGVSEIQQIQPNEKMIQVGPDLWGLIERDTGASETENMKALSFLEDYLSKSQKGIHISEVETVMNESNLPNYAEPYALFNLAQRDKRFHLVKAMFLGLAEWGGDIRRLNLTQAVKKVIDEMTEPMAMPKVQMLVEQYTGLKQEGSLAGLLVNNNAVYNAEDKTWFK